MTTEYKTTYLRPPKPPVSRHSAQADPLTNLGRFAWKYRYQLAPFYLAMGLGASAMIAGHLARAYWWAVPIIGAALIVLVQRYSHRFPTQLRLARATGRRYAVVLIVITALWYTGTVRHGGTTYHDWTILLLGTCLGSTGWWHTYRVRGSVPVRIYADVPSEVRGDAMAKARELISEWTAFCTAAGMGNGTGLRAITFDRWSVTVSIEMRMGDTLRRLGRQESLSKIESAWKGRRTGKAYSSAGIYGSCREGAARIEPAATSMAHLAVIRIMIRDPHAEPIMPPDLGLTDFEEIQIGLFETGASITFMLVNTVIAGMTDAGKSGVMNVIIRALARMRMVAIVGVDLKPGAPEFSPWRRVMHTLAVNPAEAAEVFERLIQGLTWRGEEMTRRGWKTWKPTKDHPFVVLLVDETQEIMTAQIDGRPINLKTPLDRLAAMARAYGFCVITATQYPTGPSLSAKVKQNAVQRVGLRTAEDQADRVIFGSGATKDQFTPSKISPARPGSLFIRNALYRKPTLGRAYFIPEADIPAEVEELARHRTMIDSDTWPAIEGEPGWITGDAEVEVEAIEPPDEEIIDAEIIETPADQILNLIGQAGEDGARPADLAKAMKCTTRTIYRHLDQLIAEHLVELKRRGRYVRI